MYMERRKTKDRRTNDLKQDQGFLRNRRFRPCRRLNNILLEEAPEEFFIRHPIAWIKFCKLGYRCKK